MLFLYGWGANTHGQLGIGCVSEQMINPERIEELPESDGESTIIKMYGGGGHSLLLTSQGKIFGAGMNISGQIGTGTQEKAVPNFQQIRGLESQYIIEIACGWAHSVALSDQGEVWVWGSNSHSQLGLPVNEVPFSCLPISLGLKNIVSISAGLRHTAVVDKDGRVYTWGHGHRGQLGHLDSNGDMVKKQNAPKIVNMAEIKVVQVKCGQNNTYVLTTNGDIYAWGDNKWGQLAHDPVNFAFFSCPLQISTNFFGGQKIDWLEAGWTHCVAATITGDIFLWGRRDYGQLGDSKDTSLTQQSSNLPSPRFRYDPMCLHLEKKLLSIKCGSEHNIAHVEDSNGKTYVYSWGWNEHGNCGNGSAKDVYSPSLIQLPGMVEEIGSGCGHSFALVKIV